MSGYGDKVDRIIYDLEQRNADLASEVERLRRVERVQAIRIEELERQADGTDR